MKLNKVLVGLVITLIFIQGCQTVSQKNTLSHDQMHEMMGSMLGEHFKEKHHEALHTHLENNEISKGISHEGMHQLLQDMLNDHFEEKHHDELHKFLATESDLRKVKSSDILSVNDKDRVDLSADIVIKEINGINHKFYAYNGMFPGPAYKVKQGTEIKVNFKNNIDYETTVHWHGLRHDNENDGVPKVTQDSIQPGETYEYTLKFPDSGIYWYHPHVREDLQQDKGLAGNILVEPLNEDYYNSVNREELIILDDILIENQEIVPYGKEHANFALMGRFGNTLLLNGETNYMLDIDEGEIVRFFITNVANVRPFNINFGKAKMKLIGSDIGKYEQEEFIDNVVIAPAERYIVEVYFDKEGEYMIKHATPEKEYVLGKVKVSSTKASQDFSEDFNKLKINEDIVEDVDQFREYFNKEVDYKIDLTIKMKGMMAEMMKNMEMKEMMEDSMNKKGIEWEDEMPMMNPQSTTENVEWILKDVKSEKENMDFVMNAKIGDKIKIRLFNDPDSMHPMQHPIHLHGQRFLVLVQDGEEKENLVWKDTVLVPKGSTVDILVDVTNPGEWMFHCHIAEHLEAGMMTSLNVEKSS